MANVSPRLRLVSAFVAVAILALPFADLSLAHHDPWTSLARMVAGFVRPDFGAIDGIVHSLALTVIFAVAGVSLGGAVGFLLAPFYSRFAVRSFCIAVRSVHEIFWALLLMQVIGLGPATGVIALALPYCGIFAKVFAEQIEESDPRPGQILAPKVDLISRFFYTSLPLTVRNMGTYTLYRLECGLRSSAVLGFIGLPTLGFQLDSFFKVGQYGAASAVILCYILLIATLRYWMRPRLAPVWILLSFGYLALIKSPPMGDGALIRFLTTDIVPAPLRHGEGLAALVPWLVELVRFEMMPGVFNTLIVAQIALVLTGVIGFITSAFLVRSVSGRGGQIAGHLLLVTLRSIPEYMLAFLFMQVFGPSMLPAIAALALHNGAIIGFLVGQEGNRLSTTLRPDAARGFSLWGFELAPRLFGSFTALCLYRWEIILRESAVMGMLGIATLGFFIDTEISELKLDRVLILLVAMGVLTAAIDGLSHHLRRRISGPKARRSLGETPHGCR